MKIKMMKMLKITKHLKEEPMKACSMNLSMLESHNIILKQLHQELIAIKVGLKMILIKSVD